MGNSLSKNFLRLIFSRSIRQTESRLKTDPKIKELTEKLKKNLDELEKAVDDHIDTFGG